MAKMTDVSSAKWLTIDDFMENLKSLIYRRNNKGPRVEPWGTPHDIGRLGELNPFMETYWLRLVRNDVKISSKSIVMQFFKENIMLTVSNAFSRSTNKIEYQDSPYIYCYLLTHDL